MKREGDREKRRWYSEEGRGRAGAEGGDGGGGAGSISVGERRRKRPRAEQSSKNEEEATRGMEDGLAAPWNIGNPELWPQP